MPVDTSIPHQQAMDEAKGGDQERQETAEFFILHASSAASVANAAAAATVATAASPGAGSLVSLQCELCGKTFQNMKTKTAHLKNLHHGVSNTTEHEENKPRLRLFRKSLKTLNRFSRLSTLILAWSIDFEPFSDHAKVRLLRKDLPQREVPQRA